MRYDRLAIVVGLILFWFMFIWLGLKLLGRLI